MDKIEWESTNWGKTMEELYEAGGTSRWEREAKEDKGINTVEEWIEKQKENLLEERKNKIEKSVLAKEYKRWKGVGRAKYLGQKGKGKRLKTQLGSDVAMNGKEINTGRRIVKKNVDSL